MTLPQLLERDLAFALDAFERRGWQNARWRGWRGVVIREGRQAVGEKQSKDEYGYHCLHVKFHGRLYQERLSCHQTEISI